MKWCEHLKHENGELWLNDFPLDLDFSDWNFCPVCGAKRPAEIKV